MTRIAINYKGKRNNLSNFLNVRNILLISFVLMSLVLVIYVQAVKSEENSNSTAALDSSSEFLLEEAVNEDKSSVDKESVNQSSNTSTDTITENLKNSVSVKVDNNSEDTQSENETRVNISINSSSENDADSSHLPEDSQSIRVNNIVLPIPENGRVRETIKDEDSTTRIRADIDNDGSSSIKISTKSE